MCLVFNRWASRKSSMCCVWTGGPRRPQKPFQRVGGEAPHLLEWCLGPPGPPKPPKSTISGRPKNHALKTQVSRVGFFDPGSGGSGGSREAPKGPPWAFPGPPGAPRRPPYPAGRIDPGAGPIDFRPGTIDRLLRGLLQSHRSGTVNTLLKKTL
jgi:hypothetical protein